MRSVNAGRNKFSFNYASSFMSFNTRLKHQTNKHSTNADESLEGVNGCRHRHISLLLYEFFHALEGIQRPHRRDSHQLKRYGNHFYIILTPLTTSITSNDYCATATTETVWTETSEHLANCRLPQQVYRLIEIILWRIFHQSKCYHRFASNVNSSERNQQSIVVKITKRKVDPLCPHSPCVT